jgi:hypothetical protein
MSSTRYQALFKAALLLGVFLFLKLLNWALTDLGALVRGPLRALPILPVVLCLVPLLEFCLDSPFSQISSRWNSFPWWKQWGIVLLVPVALILLMVVGALISG